MAEGFVVWITGMPRAGKTLLAKAVAERLRALGKPVELLDGGELEDMLEGPGKDARTAETRRIAWAVKYMVKYGVVPVVAATSPFREPRDKVRREIKRFTEVFVDCPFEVCMSRDKDGVYAAAMAGKTQVHGVNEPYEPPTNAEVVVRSDQESANAGAQKVLDALASGGYITVTEAGLGRKKTMTRHTAAQVVRLPKLVKAAAAKTAKAARPRPAKKPVVKAAARRGKPAARARSRRR